MSDGDWNWQHLGLQAGVPFLSAMGGWLLGIWRWGRASAKQEQAVKDDYDDKISALREEVRKSMAAQVQGAEDRQENLVNQFKEAFDGLRRQHDDHKLDVEKRFMLKDDFQNFREEYREDMRDLKASVAAIARRQ